MKAQGTISRVKRETCRIICLPSNAGCGVDGMREPWGCWLTSQLGCYVSVAVTAAGRLGYFEEEVFSPPNKSGCESSGFPFSSSDTSRIFRQHIQPTMLWTTILALLLPLTLASAALESEHDKLVKLAAAGNGVINLDEATFNLLTHPKRTWSAAIQFTAMDKRRRCNPCKCVPSFSSSSRSLIYDLGSSVLRGIP